MYNPPDYYEIDALLTDEHKMIRAAVREWVNRNVKPIIEDYAQQHKPLPTELMHQMGKLGALGPFIPEKYGGPDWTISPTALLWQSWNEVIRPYVPAFRCKVRW